MDSKFFFTYLFTSLGFLIGLAHILGSVRVSKVPKVWIGLFNYFHIPMSYSWFDPTFKRDFGYA